MSFGQTNSSTKYYNLGNAAFSRKDYEVADSLFSLSINFYPHRDTYFNRASCRQKLSDSKGFCSDLYHASQQGDKEADAIFWKKCGHRDTIYYNNCLQEFDTICVFKEIIETCNYQGFSQHFKYNRTGDLLINFLLSKTDTIILEGKDFFISNFDRSKDSIVDEFEGRILYRISLLYEDSYEKKQLQDNWGDELMYIYKNGNYYMDYVGKNKKIIYLKEKNTLYTLDGNRKLIEQTDCGIELTKIKKSYLEPNCHTILERQCHKLTEINSNGDIHETYYDPKLYINPQKFRKYIIDLLRKSDSALTINS